MTLSCHVGGSRPASRDWNDWEGTGSSRHAKNTDNDNNLSHKTPSTTQWLNHCRPHKGTASLSLHFSPGSNRKKYFYIRHNWYLLHTHTQVNTWRRRSSDGSERWPRGGKSRQPPLHVFLFDQGSTTTTRPRWAPQQYRCVITGRWFLSPSKRDGELVPKDALYNLTNE